MSCWVSLFAFSILYTLERPTGMIESPLKWGAQTLPCVGTVSTLQWAAHFLAALALQLELEASEALG